MSEHPWLKVAGVAGTLLPIGGALIGLGIYVGNLTNQIEASRSEVQLLKGQVTQLQDILQKTQEAAASGTRGPKGDKGDQGDQGPRGERGPQGEQGPAGDGSTLDQASIAQTVQKLVSQEIAKFKQAVTSSSSANTSLIDTSGGVDFSRCIPYMELREAATLTINEDSEFCGSDGVLLASVKNFNPPYINFNIPGRNYLSISQKSTNTFPWDTKRKVFVERFTETSTGKQQAILRFKN